MDESLDVTVIQAMKKLVIWYTGAGKSVFEIQSLDTR